MLNFQRIMNKFPFLFKLRKNAISPVYESNDDDNDDVEKRKATMKKVAIEEKRRGSYYSERLGCRLEGRNPKTKFLCWFRNLRAVIEDWLFLALLGILVAVCSLTMDFAIEFLQSWHIYTIDIVNAKTRGYLNIISTYSVWSGYAILLVILSALFVRLISPQAIGSGIPEMKTILRGVILKEYLTIRTLLSKMVGLTLSLGSGMPIGKEGPFVHIASVVANLLSQFVHSFEGIYSNESRSFEMLAAACAVGVSSTFSAPVGGVLFSIEVTSVYFAVRNYWRGFFAATCSATLFRILRVILNETEVTVIAFYQTKFPRDAFFPEELPIFAIVGAICGLLSAAFIASQRKCVLFLRRNKISKMIFQKHWAIYPALIAFVVGSLTYPEGFGRFLGGEKKFSQAAKDFFSDCTWSAPQNASQLCPPELLNSWTREEDYGIFTSLPCFIGTFFVLTILTSTLPIPMGIFGPSFVLGAAIGRLCGEIIAVLYPEGIRGLSEVQIFPGVYAIVGSAAFTGGVTHTVSVAVIVFELTGQLLHILPVMIAVLVANAISSYLQPSIYDSAIRIKHLPFLPDIPHTSSRFHGVLVEQFMTRDVHSISKGTSYRELQETLFNNPQLKAFPVVEDEKSRILIGSCSRLKLLRNLNCHVGQVARQQEAARRRQFRRSNSMDQEIGEDTRQNGPMVRTNSELALTDVNGNLKKQRFSVTSIKMGKRSSVSESDGLNTGKFLGDDLEEPAAVKRSLTIPASICSTPSTYSTLGEMIRTLARLSQRLRKNPELEECDLVAEERALWEKQQLAKPVDFNSIGIDPAPFQLVEHTSLFKVHSLFSLLGLNRAYVTKCGRLVGVVALRDLRKAVENVNSGDLSAKTQPLHLFGPPTVDEAECEEEEEEQERERFASVGQKDVSSDDEDEDDQNDILNPCLQVVTQPDSMYGTNTRKISTDVRLQVQRTSKEALKGAVKLLARGMLGSSAEERATKSAEIDAEKGERSCGDENATTTQNSDQIPIFVISSSSEDECPQSEQETEREDIASCPSSTPKQRHQRKVRVISPPDTSPKELETSDNRFTFDDTLRPSSDGNERGGNAPAR